MRANGTQLRSTFNTAVLLKEKKFRDRGNKEGALQALDEDGLGELEKKQTKGSVQVRDVSTIHHGLNFIIVIPMDEN